MGLLGDRKNPRRRTHPQAPLYFNASGIAPTPEVMAQISDQITVLGVAASDNGLRLLTGHFNKLSDLVTPALSTPRLRCKVFNSANLTTASGAGPLVVAFNSASFDPSGLHSLTVNNSRITIPVGGDTGVWLFSAQVSWAANGVGFRFIQITKNGATIASSQLPACGGVNTIQPLSIIDPPAVGDYYEVFVQQNSGGNLDVVALSLNTFFSAVHLW